MLFVVDFSIEIEQQVFGVTQEGFDDTQELLLKGCQENYSATIIGAKSVMLDFFSGRIICIKTMHHTDVNKTKVQFELIY